MLIRDYKGTKMICTVKSYIIKIVFCAWTQVDALIEAFGTTKQKRALSSRRLNQVGNDTLQQAVALAAKNIIDQKGVESK